MKIKSKNSRLYLIINLSIVMSILCTIGLTTIIYYNNQYLDEELIDRARFLIQSIEITREWNTSTGGVYAAKTDDRKSLKNFKKNEMTSVNGKKYTLKNSSVMTIEMSRMSGKGGLFSFNITSLEPLNKSNTADDFESEALKLFETGIKEYHTKIKSGNNTLLRYMTPLRAKDECLVCHDRKLYKTGDIIGGISISMDITSSERRAAILEYCAIIFGTLSFFFTAGVFLISSCHMRIRLERADKKIRILSVTDDLTLLYNRNYFFQKLHEEFERARRYNHPLSLIIANIDSLRTYNEKHGLEAGDLVLKNAADIIKPVCRESDIVARYGAEEFAILLPDTGDKGALVIAEKLRFKVEEYKYRENSEPVTISLGIAAMSPDSAYSAETLIYDAGTALDRAKVSGRNRAMLYSPI